MIIRRAVKTRRLLRHVGTVAATPPSNFKPEPFGYHEELTLRIEDLTNRGFGVARHSNGCVVMVPQVIPGEVVLARVFRNHKSYSEADLVTVLEPSASRKPPDCALFGTCGGCQYQHMTIDEQRKWKRKQVADSLERLAKAAPADFPGVEELIGTDALYGYRCKLTPHYGAPPKGNRLQQMIEDQTAEGQPPTTEIELNFPIGFYETSRRRLVDVPSCPIATPAINSELVSVRARVKEDVETRMNGALKERAQWQKEQDAKLEQEAKQATTAAGVGVGDMLRTSPNADDIAGAGASNVNGKERDTGQRVKGGERKGAGGQLKGGNLKKIKGATLLLRDVDAGVVTSHQSRVTHTFPRPQSSPNSAMADLRFEFGAADFFQNNLHVVRMLLLLVVGAELVVVEL
jgi:tRNA/tmRNA/rRNA uracil-C5-methylase (TrmA/RlmC/RlmD family)